MSEMNQNRTPSGGGAPGHGRREVPRQRSGRSQGRKRRPIWATVLIRFFQVLGTLLLVGVVTGSFMACYAAVYVKTVVMPQAVQATQDIAAMTLNENSVIYYYDKETGEPVELQTLVGSENRELVAYDDIPEELINAYVAIEDKRFYTHHGVDWKRTAAGVIYMFTGHSIQGGSTITQQLIKNMTEYDDVTVTRKIVEIFTALEIESNYEKKDILELYLNKIYLGNNCYGVQAAAQYYFGKDVSDLTLAECASLAGITNNPSLYSPNAILEVTRYECQECGYYSLSNDEPCDSCGAENWGPAEIWNGREYNKARQELILALMADPEISEDGAYISQMEYEAAVAEPLVFRWDKTGDDTDGDGDKDDSTPTTVYSWYVDAVISELIQDLMAEGRDKDTATRIVYSGGLSIYVPYDPDVQAAVDAVYNDRSNLDFVSASGQKLMSAITVVDNSNGHVVAMAGDVGEKTVSRGWNAAVDTYRQPGSSIKPLSVYSPALEMGLITPATVVDDAPIRLMNGTAWPKNLPREYKGLTTVLAGVTRSANTVATRVLEMVTLRESFNFMVEKYGFTSMVEAREVNGEIKSDIDWSPLAMGGLTDGVSTFEMAAAYATFPRNGVYTEPTTYLLVEDNGGKVLIDNTPARTTAIKESTAYYINSMLTNVVTSGTGTSARIAGHTVAGKTGTTDNGYDLWFAGYTKYYTAAVWTGYPNSEVIETKQTGHYISVILWRKVMEQLLADLPGQKFDVPGETETVAICLDTGLRAGEDCKNDIRGGRVVNMTFLKGDAPTEYCTAHVPVTICLDDPILDAKGNPTGAYHLATEFCPEESVKEVSMLEYTREVVDPSVTVEDYYAHMSIYDGLEEGAEYCTVHTEETVEPPEPEESDEPIESDDPWWNWPWNWPEPSDSPEPTPSVDVGIPPEESDPLGDPPED